VPIAAPVDLPSPAKRKRADSDLFSDSEPPSAPPDLEVAKPQVPERPSTPEALRSYNLEGLYILESGVCTIVHPHDSYHAKELKRWDFFGECDLLKVVVRNHLLKYRATPTSATSSRRATRYAYYSSQTLTLRRYLFLNS